MPRPRNIFRPNPTSIRLSKEERRKIDRYAERLEMGPSSLIQDIVNQWIAEQDRKPFRQLKKESAAGQTWTEHLAIQQEPIDPQFAEENLQAGIEEAKLQGK